MFGLCAVAWVSYPTSNENRRGECLESAGIWGIASDSGEDYIKDVAKEEVSELKTHLEMFGVNIHNFSELATQAINDMEV
jgi:hypothetical protein